MMSDGGWYPVGLASGIEPGTSAGTRLFGQELVVWRDAAGASHVWEDRCPHRGMRLSFGFVRGDHIACLYHGWRFDGGGQCRFIPAHPTLDVPKTIAVTRFVSAERSGIVWVHAGAPDVSEPVPGGNRAMTPVRSITVSAGATAVLTALDAMPAPWGSGAPAVVEKHGPLISVKPGSDRLDPLHPALVLALQPLSDEETCLHVAIEGDADRADERLSVSRWAEALRRQAEAVRSRSCLWMETIQRHERDRFQ